jgi:hypothetical protein
MIPLSLYPAISTRKNNNAKKKKATFRDHVLEQCMHGGKKCHGWRIQTLHVEGEGPEFKYKNEPDKNLFGHELYAYSFDSVIQTTKLE